MRRNGIIGEVRVAKKQKKRAAKKTAKQVKKSSARTTRAAKTAPLPGPVWQWSAVDIAAAIRSGAVSAVEVTEAHIARLRTLNPKLNAVVVDLTEDALRAAKA